MVPDENNNEIPDDHLARTGLLGRPVNVNIFRVEGEGPFNLTIRNNMLALLHGGYCLNEDGHYGPHLRCDERCPFTHEMCFKHYSAHLPTCQLEVCPYPYCKETSELLKHFVNCLAADCKRCQGPVFSLMNELVEDLIMSGKAHEVDEVQAEEFPLWKFAFIHVTLRKWVYDEVEE